MVPQNNAAGRPSIYINPKAFRGDLSALKLKNVEQGTLKTTQIMHTNVAGVTTKPRKVLKIVKDKYGNILSRVKVKWFKCLLTVFFINFIIVFLSFGCKSLHIYPVVLGLRNYDFSINTFYKFSTKNHMLF